MTEIQLAVTEDIDIIAEWLKRLRSGNYKQCFNSLKCPDEPNCFCVAGILIDIWLERYPDSGYQWGEYTLNSRIDDAHYESIPIEIIEALRLNRYRDEYDWPLIPRMLLNLKLSPSNKAKVDSCHEAYENDPYRDIALYSLNDRARLTFIELAELIEDAYLVPLLF